MQAQSQVFIIIFIRLLLESFQKLFSLLLQVWLHLYLILNEPFRLLILINQCLHILLHFGF
jgi:hypothetical protein